MADLMSHIQTICRRAIVESKDKPLGMNNIFALTPFFDRMMKSGRLKKQGGGYSIYQPIEYGINPNIRWIADDDSIPRATKQKRTMVNVDWREIAGHIPLDGMTYIVKNGGKEQIIDGIKAEIANCKYGISEAMEQALHSSGGVPAAGAWIVGGSVREQFDGLGLINSATATYGGITYDQLGYKKDGSTYIWAANVDTSTTALTMLALMKQINKQKGMGSNPTLLLTTPSIHAKIWSLFNTFERYTKGVNDVYSEEKFSIGGRNVEWSPYTDITTADTAETLHILDEKYISMVMSPYRMPEVKNGLEDIDADVTVTRVIYAGNLICSRRDAQGKFTAIDPDT